ncbi:MAG: N-acetylmuramoyl-L-alanine amidase [Bacilli bacterium]|nr:N-acetylmuramoyl-L-alanine amidase [Bacilli bacterium]
MKFIKKYKFTFLGFLTATILSSFFLMYVESKKLTPFKIISFEQNTIKKETMNLLKWTNSKNAVKYSVAVLNEDLQILKAETTTNNEINLDNVKVETNKSLIIDVIAYDKNGNQLKAEPNHYKTTWENPTIQKNNLKDGVLNNLDWNINLLYKDNINFDDYYFILKTKDEVIHKKNVDGNTTTISKDILNVLYGEYTLQLCKDIDNERVIVDNINFEIKLPDISDISVTNPIDNDTVVWDDFNITFDGGENATNYYMSLIDQDGNIIFEDEEVPEKSKQVDINLLKEEMQYNLKINAINYLDKTVQKTSTTIFTTSKKQTVSNINSSIPSGEIGKGNSIKLYTKTTDAKIYYTTNGDIPTENSILYTGPIKIDKNMTIKAIAIRKNMYNSKVLELNYKIPINVKAIYLSPSTQYWNLGVSSVGYTNERDMMNKVANYVQDTLEKRGIKVYRNNPNWTYKEAAADSKTKNVSMHVALHSNASSTLNPGIETGIETWVFDETCKTQMKIAQKIQDALMSIYYDKNGNRGVKYSKIGEGFYETNPDNVHNGVLVEIAFHDNPKDAAWIVNNQKIIGETIANAIASYLGH